MSGIELIIRNDLHQNADFPTARCRQAPMKSANALKPKLLGKQEVVHFQQSLKHVHVTRLLALQCYNILKIYYKLLYLRDLFTVIFIMSCSQS